MLSLLTAIVLVVAGCGSGASSALPVVQISIGSKQYNIEVARNTADMEHGLMDRPAMPADHGMLFVFPDSALRQFWMKDTLIPLDILFLDGDGRVVSVHQMQPKDLNITSSDVPAKYAIELNEGQAEKTGVKIGDLVALPAQAK